MPGAIAVAARLDVGRRRRRRRHPPRRDRRLLAALRARRRLVPDRRSSRPRRRAVVHRGPRRRDRPHHARRRRSPSTRCPPPSAFAGDIAAGPDGALYFSEATPARSAASRPPAPSPSSTCPARTRCPAPIVPGPDGALYVAERNDNVDLPHDDRRRVHRRVRAPARERRPALDGQGRRRRALHLRVHGRRRLAHDVRRHVHEGLPHPRRLQRPRRSRLPTARCGSARAAAARSRGSTSGSTTRSPPRARRSRRSAGKTVNATVATFTDGDPNARPGDYEVHDQLGRRRPLVRHRPARGRRLVRRQGKHAYAKQGSRKVVVRITDGVGKGLDAKVTSWAIVLR